MNRVLTDCLLHPGPCVVLLYPPSVVSVFTLAHIACDALSSFSVMGVPSVSEARKTLRCSVCMLRGVGAAIQCCVPSCAASFHAQVSQAVTRTHHTHIHTQMHSPILIYRIIGLPSRLWPAYVRCIGQYLVGVSLHVHDSVSSNMRRHRFA